MNALSSIDLKDLSQRRDSPVVTLLIPTVKSGPQTRQSPIHFKNVVSEARKRLEGSPNGQALLKQLAEECEPKIEDHDFWQRQSEGLAVLCDGKDCRYVYLPESPDGEHVFLGDRFHIKPLLPIVARNQEFYLLVLSGNVCKLFRGDNEALREEKVEGLPSSLAEALRFDDPEQSLQHHTGAQTPSPGNPAVFHGQGGGEDDRKDRFLRYFQACDHALANHLNGSGLPLILATVDEHVPLYKRANSYSGLVEDHWVSGGPDDKSETELHRQVREVLSELTKSKEDRAIEELRQALGTDQGSRSLKEISQAIQQGRVAKAFIAADVAKPGHVDPASGKVDLDNDASEDVLNDIAADALLMGGQVYVLESGRIPDGVPAAAIFRF